MDALDVLTAVTLANVRLGEITDDGGDLDGDTGDLAAALHELGRLISQARSLEALVTEALVARMTSKQTQVGPWRLERHGGSKRTTWQSEELFAELVRRARVDMETGEVLDDRTAQERLIDAVRACVPLTGSLGWRIAALRAHGIDPDEWCTRAPAPFRVRVTYDATTDEAASTEVEEVTVR